MSLEYKGKYNIIETDNLKRYPIGTRLSKVNKSMFCSGEFKKGILDFVDSLPDILKAEELKELVNLLTDTCKKKNPFMIAMGAHVIKCGLSPLIIRMMNEGLITHLALNGAGAIHDFEVALIGETSEEVADGIIDGSFGMSEDTGNFLNNAAKYASENCLGFGEAIGELMEVENIPGKESSLLYMGWKNNVPVTIHVAIGTDIIHPHPSFNGKETGYATATDFHIFMNSVSQLKKESAYFNIGSAVIMPEVFLKALTTVRNLKHETFEFYTVNCDMKDHYRPKMNVTGRPALGGGRSFSFTGHHEIMLPLLFGALLEKLEMEKYK